MEDILLEVSSGVEGRLPSMGRFQVVLVSIGIVKDTSTLLL